MDGGWPIFYKTKKDNILLVLYARKSLYERYKDTSLSEKTHLYNNRHNRQLLPK